MKSYVVIGLGRFGTRIAAKLYELGEDVLAIDTNEAVINDIADNVSKAVIADAKDIDVLKGLGVQSCDCAIVAIGSDLAASVLVTMNLKNLGIPQIICKTYDETHSEILRKLGADKVIIPEHIMADKTARILSAPNILEHIELSEDYGISELSAPKTWVGHSLRELNIRAKFGVFIIGVRINGQTKISPDADHIIEKDSVLILLGDYDSLKKIRSAK